MQFEAGRLPFSAPAAIFVPPIVTHAFYFKPQVTDGWVLTFTEDSISRFGNLARQSIAPLRILADQPIIPIGDNMKSTSLSYFCSELFEEYSLARKGYEVTIHGLLAIIAIRIMRLSERLSHDSSVALAPSDATVAKLRALVEGHFREQRSIAFYASKLAMTPDRLNDHVKRSIGVSPGHIIRQRIVAEAKWRLVSTMEPIKNIASELTFSDASHFSRFFAQYVGMTPQEFRVKRGG